MKKLILLYVSILSFLLTACSIGKDRKEFKCTQWEVEQQNSTQAEILASIQNSALGSIAVFEFYNNQIRMSFKGDQIVLNRVKNGNFIYGRTVNINGKSASVMLKLRPNGPICIPWLGLYGFVTSMNLGFYVDGNYSGEASFSREW